MERFLDELTLADIIPKTTKLVKKTINKKYGFNSSGNRNSNFKGIATSVTFFINRGNNLKNLNDQLDNIFKISIQYPYLENPIFTSTWNENRDSTDEKYLRYDNYCNLVFNYIERLCKYYKYDENKIQNHINIKSWIRVHKNCWNNPSTPYENADGYPNELKSLITRFLQ